MIVPSLVPIILPWKRIRDNERERSTQSMSKPIFILPKFLFALSDIAFTKASPEFIITLAMTDKAIPNPRIKIPHSTKKRWTM